MKCGCLKGQDVRHCEGQFLSIKLSHHDGIFQVALLVLCVPKMREDKDTENHQGFLRATEDVRQW